LLQLPLIGLTDLKVLDRMNALVGGYASGGIEDASVAPQLPDGPATAFAQ
jgi:hypothetical protein